MTSRRIELPQAQGVMDALVHLPEGDGPWPLVVFYMDAFGLRPALTAMAGRLAAAGYAVLQPNLYWRSGAFAPFAPATTFGDPAERARITALMTAVRAEEVASDTLVLVTEAALDGRVRTDRLGCLGYCMGGRMAFGVSAELGGRVVACASIHPGGLVTAGADSPHRRSAEIAAAVYLGIADEDRGCTPEHQEALRRALGAAGVRHTLEVYAGARHGFAVPDHAVYDAPAAERHWERVLALFDAELRDFRRGRGTTA